MLSGAPRKMVIHGLLDFYDQPQSTRTRQIKRIMQESAVSFTHANTAREYINLYEKMLKRPLILREVSNPDPGEKGAKRQV